MQPSMGWLVIKFGKDFLWESGNLFCGCQPGLSLASLHLHDGSMNREHITRLEAMHKLTNRAHSATDPPGWSTCQHQTNANWYVTIPQVEKPIPW
jgi:hypothetical protein